ncbi:hypothetical protein CSKR_109409 [Clonorchis sinensis]|uniref:Uncharacterized protein n=1 Tax=Clonorchis sinensis TaxID=79923 RepID=A0A3R7D0F9_CLOSI|nr:hypothetical protein CSKR_109409 [Clonorchis sinensis]
MSVDDRLLPDGNKLMYFPHHRYGEAIEHCVFLPGKLGYHMAMDILRTQFGRPHDIAQSFMNELLVRGPVAPGDFGALQRLIRKTVNLDLELGRMHYTADLNSPTNLKRKAESLPRNLQQSLRDLGSRGGTAANRAYGNEATWGETIGSTSDYTRRFQPELFTNTRGQNYVAQQAGPMT